VETNHAENLAQTIRLDERLRERRFPVLKPVPQDGFSIGQRIGIYHIEDRIGQGGMGLVYRARDTVLDRTVALKVLPPELAQNAEFLSRFRTEAYAQARLHHPNIVTLFSVLEISAGFILVLEFVEGETLHQRIQRQGPLDAAEAVTIYEQALRGVAFAHQAGIVHRDLKPDNIFVTRQDEVKIMDFGVAKIMESKEPTRARSMVGTLLYISPEQINGRDADPRSDIYTLGIGLFEAVTGRLPFERKTDFSLMHAHMLEAPPQPRSLQRNLPRALESVILKAIEKDPARRYQNAEEFRDALLKQSRRHKLAVSSASMPGLSSNHWLARLWSWRGRAFGHLGFDIMLLVIASALVLSLGLYPSAKRPADDVAPVTHLSTPKVRTLTATGRARQDTTRQDPDDRNRNGSGDRNRYDSLRKAWGG